jgi:hypothetical protein
LKEQRLKVNKSKIAAWVVQVKQYSTNRTTRTSISVPEPLGTSGSFGQWQVLKVIALSFSACLDVHQVIGMLT